MEKEQKGSESTQKMCYCFIDCYRSRNLSNMVHWKVYLHPYSVGCCLSNMLNPFILDLFLVFQLDLYQIVLFWRCKICLNTWKHWSFPQLLQFSCLFLFYFPIWTLIWSVWLQIKCCCYFYWICFMMWIFSSEMTIHLSIRSFSSI